MDRGAWQATVHGVMKSRTRLKWFSTYSEIEHLHRQRKSETQDVWVIDFCAVLETPWALVLWGEFRMKELQGWGSHLSYEAAEQGSFGMFEIVFSELGQFTYEILLCHHLTQSEKIPLCIQSGSWVQPMLPVKGWLSPLTGLGWLKTWPWRTDFHHLLSRQSGRPLSSRSPQISVFFGDSDFLGIFRLCYWKSRGC